MSSHKQWMLYGANGYTGRLIVAEALKRGLRPVLAGRNAAVIEAMAVESGLEHRLFGLDDNRMAAEALEGFHTVLHCAGPFSATSQQMIDACLQQHCHYLDITGEISVFANAHGQAEDARRADIVLMPGVGFDVVPTDCLAATLVQQLPAATRLALAFKSGGRMSRGTAKTSIEGLANGGCVRRAGKLQRVPLAWKAREIPFDGGTSLAVTIPWGDVFTAYISTGIPDIEVYMAVSQVLVKRMKRMRLAKPLLSMQWVQNVLKRRVEKSIAGPSGADRASSHMQLWGEVASADGRSVSAVMTTPDGYDVTATASLGVVEYLLENEIEGGFYTPSLLMGADYASRLPGVSCRINS
ncbi:MAG: saccharopine dehydrogenase NADP-binding domain-containing protein [Xanthomonadales bacterium]|nr:saccharopine dehydrogenase NADP-binding domain-containing protein [Xanthomonadales bacterium]